MKAAYIEAVGSPDVIVFGDLPVPVVRENQVLVKVNAVTVDPIDTYIRRGLYETDLTFPFIVGRDMIGTVYETGRSVTSFTAGEEVWCNNQGYAGRQGTFAEFIAVDEDLLYKLPSGTDKHNVLCSVHSAITAVVGLCGKAKLTRGERIFINGGSGNLGNAAIQLAKHLGATVAVTAGSGDKAAWCLESGADLVIDYHKDDVNVKVAEFAPSGVDVYWDMTKTPELDTAVSLTKRRGRILLSSGISHKSTISVGAFYTRNCSLFGFTITDLTESELAEWAKLLNELFEKNVFRSRIAAEMKLAEAAAAHRIMDSTNLAGKLLLTV